MYLIFGSLSDPCCMQVEEELRKRGCAVRTLENPFSERERFMWRFGTGSPSGSSLQSRDSRACISAPWGTSSGQIEGVFLRDNVSDMTGWSEVDAPYIASEMQAALLGWLWSLPCPVVNRLPAWLFLMPPPSFLQWIPWLTRAGLCVPAVVVSNSSERIESWRTLHADGAVLAPISTDTHFALHSSAEWDGVIRLTRHTPVALRQPHGKTQLACVVGCSVVWNAQAETLPMRLQAVEPVLLKFACSAGLNFLQIALAELAQSASGETAYAVVAVDTRVDLNLFEEEQQTQIAQRLTDLLTSSHHLAQSAEVACAPVLAGGTL